jgi:hypothetical protein
MSSSQTAGKQTSSNSPNRVVSAGSPVAAEEVQALLNSLAGNSVPKTVPETEHPVDPKLQSWFMGMLNFLPEEESSSRPTADGTAVPAGSRSTAGPVPADTRRDRGEAWELEDKRESAASLHLESVTPGSKSNEGGSPAVTTDDLARLISLARLIASVSPAPPQRESFKQKVVPPLRLPDPSECQLRGPTTPAPSQPSSILQTENVVPEPTDADQEKRDSELSERVMLELRRVPAVAHLCIQVKTRGGKATLMGELNGDYERQLVVHFARLVRGVDEVVDLTRVRAAVSARVPPGQKSAVISRPTPRKPAIPRRTGGTSWTLPLHPGWIVGVAGVFVLAWCGLSFGKRDVDRIEVHPAQGRVQFGDAIPQGALLTLHPLSPALSIRPKATVRTDGTFQVSTYGASDGAPEGDYRVTIVWHQLVEVDGEPTAGPNLLPPSYSQPGTTDLRVSVKPGTNELSPLQIRP